MGEARWVIIPSNSGCFYMMRSQWQMGSAGALGGDKLWIPKPQLQQQGQWQIAACNRGRRSKRNFEFPDGSFMHDTAMAAAAPSFCSCIFKKRNPESSTCLASASDHDSGSLPNSSATENQLSYSDPRIANVKAVVDTAVGKNSDVNSAVAINGVKSGSSGIENGTCAESIASVSGFSWLEEHNGLELAELIAVVHHENGELETTEASMHSQHQNPEVDVVEGNGAPPSTSYARRELELQWSDKYLSSDLGTPNSNGTLPSPLINGSKNGTPSALPKLEHGSGYNKTNGLANMNGSLVARIPLTKKEGLLQLTEKGHTKDTSKPREDGENLPNGTKENGTAHLLNSKKDRKSKTDSGNGALLKDKRDDINGAAYGLNESGRALASYEMLVRAGRLRDCLNLLEDLERKGMLDMDKIYHARFFQTCKRQRAVDCAFRFMHLIKNPSLRTFNAVLSVCCSAADVDGAFRAFAEVEKAGLKADCMLFTTLLSTCAKAGEVDLMFKVFHDMETKGVEANAYTYGAMIDGCARSGQTAKAFGVYRIMTSKKIKPDRVIYNSLINACGHSGDVQRALNVLSEMKNLNKPIEPNHVTMGSLVKACARSNKAEDALNVYHMMRNDGVKGSCETYTIAVHACSQEGNVVEAFRIYEDMKKDHVKPDEVFFSALIDVAGHAGQINTAFSVLEEMEKIQMAPSPITYSALMGACSNTGEWEKAWDLYNDMQAMNMQPTVSTLNALITALCKGNQLRQSIQALTEAKQAGIAPNQITYSALLEACEKEDDYEAGIELYLAAMKDNVLPNLTMCESIIDLCLRRIQRCDPRPKLACPFGPPFLPKEAPYQQWASWALATYRQAISAGITPTKRMLSQLFGCLRLPEVPSLPDAYNGLYTFGNSQPPRRNPSVDGFDIYDPRASAIFEEAAAMGVVPTFSFTKGPVVVDAELMPSCAAEVCILTIVKALKHRHATGAKLPNIIIKFNVEKKMINENNNVSRTINASSRNGHTLAALLRRLRVQYKGNESRGKLTVPGTCISEWFKRTAASSGVQDYLHSPSLLGKNNLRQQEAIRMGEIPPISYLQMCKEWDKVEEIQS